ncbi:MAG: hypothetical protein JWO31_1798, partial [Phycisphaerales bacterium]|nr:hypothetical protein [Phycisphaerales bacterium]
MIDRSAQQPSRGTRARAVVSAMTLEPLEGRRLMSVVGFYAATDAGNDAATAVAVGAADKTRFARTETIGSPTDPADYYAFTVTANTAVTVKIGASAKPAKLVKQVAPSVQLTNADRATGFVAGKRSGKQSLGPGTYYVAVTGTSIAEPNGVTYRLSIVTKPYKNTAKFDSPTDGGTTNTDGGGTTDLGGGTTTGQNGGTFTGSLHFPSQTEGNTFADQWEFVATQDGTFSLPATIADDTTWLMVPDNPDGTASSTGG